MVAKKRKVKPSRMDDVEIDSEVVSVEAEVEEQEVSDNSVIQITVATVAQIVKHIDGGIDEGVTFQYLTVNTNEIVCTEKTTKSSVIYTIDPSSWANEIATALFEYEGEGQDPETIDAESDGYEYIIKAKYK